MAEKIVVERLSLYYGAFPALKNINLRFQANRVTALIGPSGCGKSTFLRTLNRMNDLIPGVRREGTVLLDGQDIYSPRQDVVELRRRVGMVFQRPNPFPMSIFDNVAFGPRRHGRPKPTELRETVEESLERAALWDEVKDNLHRPAWQLSGGQQQRLCIARALAVRPEVLLMDEPASALDPISTAKIEELILQLRESYTIIIVTHNLQEAARISEETAFFLQGELVEMAPTDDLFTNPQDPRTEQYLTGRYG